MGGGGSRDRTAGGGRRKKGEGGGWRQRSFWVFVARRTFLICIRCVNAEIGMFWLSESLAVWKYVKGELIRKYI